MSIEFCRIYNVWRRRSELKRFSYFTLYDDNRRDLETVYRPNAAFRRHHHRVARWILHSLTPFHLVIFFTRVFLASHPHTSSDDGKLRSFKRITLYHIIPVLWLKEIFSFFLLSPPSSSSLSWMLVMLWMRKKNTFHLLYAKWTVSRSPLMHIVVGRGVVHKLRQRHQLAKLCCVRCGISGC